jgi:membrane protein implicated in regulation of membrane protease activity
MTITILWYYWLILGMLLLIGEMLLPSFTLLWFGLAALLTGLLLLLIPTLALSGQLLFWAAASIGFTVLWFKFFKPTMTDKTKAGISREAVIGETGFVIKVPYDEIRGTVRFSMPLLGADEWEFICNQDCKVGDRVEVVDVSGNTLVVNLKN